MRRSVLLTALGCCLTPALTRAAGPDESWIQKRVDYVKAAEINGWRKIPWVSTMLEARRLSAKEKQPVFLFSHDGNIETGRC